jgi:hypothetical protein
MAFPSSPVNGQVATVGGITYTYSSTKTAWSRTPSTGANLLVFSATITGSTVSSSTTTGALIVTGGVGVGGSMNVGGTVTATTLVGTFSGSISSLQVTTALGFTPISAVPNASTQVTSLGVGTAASGTTGEIRATNNITAYYSSDSKFKENIQEVDNALDKVCAIGSKTFDWTENYIASRGGEDGYFVQKSDFGVVAQDVQAVFPQAVRTREDGTLAVDYEKLATLAFGAIKELVKRIELLESK